MKHKSDQQTFRNWLLSTGGWAVFSMFVWELVEEAVENLIAYALSSAVALFVTKAISALVIITATQGIKVSIKRFLIPFFKKLIYKEGNDKVEKIKKFFSWVNANKGTIGGVAVGALTAVSGVGLVDVSAFPALIIGGFNITPILYYTILGVLTILCSFFPETVEQFKARLEKIKAEKEKKANIKIAEKEIANEEKLANQTQAQQEKAQAKAQAEADAKAKKEKAEQEKRAKIDAIKAQLIANKQSQ